MSVRKYITPTEGSRKTFIAVTGVFVILGASLAALMLAYWLWSLQPRLKAEATAQAELLSRSQANALAHALETADAAARRAAVVRAIDELLLLTDPNTGANFFQRIELQVDYDVVPAEPGSLDLARGSAAPTAFATETAVYDAETAELRAVARFYVSDHFYRDLAADLQKGLLTVAGGGLALLFALWLTLIALLRKLQVQRDVFQEALHLAKEQAEAANEAKSRFLANMSHEIRTPLNGIMGLTALALKSEVPPKLADYLQKIKGSARLLTELIEDILDLSRIEEGRLQMQRVEFDLDAVLADLGDVIAAKAASRNLEILFDVGADVPRKLHGDPVRLKQVLLNLLGNALKFTEQGEIVLAIGVAEQRRERAELRFAVRDSGIGIPAEHIPTLFDPFTQVDTSATRRYGGMGLGLAISRRLVEMMGGAIGVESRVGHGSTFRFSAIFDVAGDALPRRGMTDQFRGLRVLLADDNANARTVLGEMLRSFHCEVTAVASGDEALAEAGRRTQAGHPYHLAVLDWHMPGTDGLEAARRLRQAQGARMPVVLVTAYDAELAARDLSADVDRVLSKPISPSAMHDAVLGLLQGRGAAPQGAAAQTRFAEGQRVLLAEDNAINREVAGEMLRAMGLTVVNAMNGREALRLIESESFDAVLMDVQMPEMDGITAVQLLRKDARFAQLPVIAMTAHAMIGDRERFIGAGMTDYIAKPIDETELFRVLSRYLRAAAGAPAAHADAPRPPERINFAEGLKRVGGKEALYAKLFHSFRGDTAGLATRLTALFDARDGDGAQQLLHATRGAAAMLGLHGVAGACGALEAALKRGESAELAPLALALDELAGVTPPGGHRAAEPAAADAAADAAALPALMEEFAALLRSKNLRAPAVFATMKGLLGEKRVDVTALEEALDALDYARALEILGAMSTGGEA